MPNARELFARRARRTRYALRLRGQGKPRLSVFRSSRNIHVQLIDDARGETIAAASSLDKALRETLRTGADKDAAAAVGRLVGARAVEKGVTEAVFDRGGYRYHGRVKALADGAREAGLKF